MERDRHARCIWPLLAVVPRVKQNGSTAAGGDVWSILHFGGSKEECADSLRIVGADRLVDVVIVGSIAVGIAAAPGSLPCLGGRDVAARASLDESAEDAFVSTLRVLEIAHGQVAEADALGESVDKHARRGGL